MIIGSNQEEVFSCADIPKCRVRSGKWRHFGSAYPKICVVRLPKMNSNACYVTIASNETRQPRKAGFLRSQAELDILLVK